jgi:hypothetical protein
MGKYPAIIGLQRGGGAKYFYALGLAVDVSADWS